VLLLNTCLTVRRGEANSHQGKGWELLTQKVIDTVVKVRSNGVVFMAWGTPAQKRTVGIPVDKHLILKSVHPSPLSASRGFFDCHHFTKANTWLVQRYGKDGAIDWNLNVDPEAIVESTITGQPADPKESAKAKDVKETKGQSGNEDEFEADIDSDEEAALREAGL